MSNVKQQYAILSLGGRDYPLSLTFNVIDELQEKYGSIEGALEKSAAIKELINIIRMLVWESVDIHNDSHPDEEWDKPDAKKIGRLIDINNISKVNAALASTFGLSLPSAESDNEESEKNATTA